MSADLLVFVLTGVPGGIAAGTAAVFWYRATRRTKVQADGRSGWSRFVEDVFGVAPTKAASTTSAPASAGTAPTAAAPPPSPVVAQEGDETLLMAADPRIPSKCREKSTAVIGTIDVLRLRMADRPESDPLRVEVEAIRSRHLSEALHRYADIPEEHRAEFFRRTGKSASFHLAETIDVMAKRLEEISKTLAKEKLDRFANSNRFIDTQYGDADPFGNR